MNYDFNIIYNIYYEDYHKMTGRVVLCVYFNVLFLFVGLLAVQQVFYVVVSEAQLCSYRRLQVVATLSTS